MGSGYTLVLDAGTSSPRCFVFDGKGDIAGASLGEWRYSAIEDASSLSREFDPQALWADLCGLVRAALSEAKASADEVVAIGVTSQRQGVAFLDRSGRELYVGPNLDIRAVFEGAAIDEEFGDKVYKATGHRPSFLFTPAKLRWFQTHRPEAYGRIATVLSLADWMAWRLTGEVASESTLAAEAGLLDIHRRRWATELLDDMGLAVNGDVPLVEATAIAGRVSESAAADSGLRQDTPVVTCGADTQCGLLGMGVAQTGQVGVVAGWSTPLQMVTDSPILSPEGKTWAGCFLTTDKWVLESSAGDAGNSYRWLAQALYGGGEGVLDAMDAAASAVTPGSEGASAFLGPAQMDMSKLGLRTGGLLFPVPLTYSDAGRGHLARASLEAIAFAVRANLKQIEELAGIQATSVHLGGGMTRTQTFVRILVDVLEREIMVSDTPHVSALGAYLCTATALGEFESLDESAAIASARLKCFKPDPLRAAEYSEHYNRWCRLSEQLGQFET